MRCVNFLFLNFNDEFVEKMGMKKKKCCENILPSKKKS